jgi:hypothetical protein
MFKLDESQTYEWPVVGRLYGDQAFDFVASFRRLSRSQLRELQEAAAGIQSPADEVAYVQRFLAGWRGVFDAQGAEIAFSPEALAKLLDVGGVDEALIDTFHASLKGAREKN